MRLVLDFDHTLYSTKSLYEAIKAAFAGLGVSDELFQQTFQDSKGKGRDYKPARQMKLIEKQTGIKGSKMQKAFAGTLKVSPKFLYPDTIDFLKNHQKIDTLFMLSYGEEKFQKMKVASAKISKYFRKVKITRDIGKSKPFKALLSKKEKVLFLEDNPQALMDVKKVYPQVIAVRIRRGEGKYAETPDNEYIDFQIKNLQELEEIIDNLIKKK
ncbi:MAG: HAD hydrolase-like protein [Candidatus Paceibacterota bacterium]|jgi:FMN phosphatase YigB (HAD superfamily)